VALRLILHVDSLGGAVGRAVAGVVRERVGEIEVLDARAASWDAVDPGRYAGIVLSGSFSSAYDPDPWILGLGGFVRDVVDRGETPMLGICFGHQLVAHALGGRVVARPPVRRAIEEIERTVDDPIFGPLPKRFRALVAHQDHVVVAPPGFEVTATSGYTGIQGLRHVGKPVWTVQFHPDFDVRVVRTPGAGDFSGIADADLAACTAPVILESFAAIARR
jgi:GMP synthase (glutamine-hydrolysing)